MQSTLPTSSSAIERSGGPTDPTGDEQLRRGFIATDVSRGVAWLLTLLFLGAIYAVPLAQAYLEKREDEESSLADLVRRPPTTENLRRLEKGIEDASYAKAWVQPRAQLLLTRLGRVGNKLAVVGHGGWLYYTPGVQHVSGPGFFGARRAAGPRQGSPRRRPGAHPPGSATRHLGVPASARATRDSPRAPADAGQGWDRAGSTSWA